MSIAGIAFQRSTETSGTNKDLDRADCEGDYEDSGFPSWLERLLMILRNKLNLAEQLCPSKLCPLALRTLFIWVWPLFTTLAFKFKAASVMVSISLPVPSTFPHLFHILCRNPICSQDYEE